MKKFLILILLFSISFWGYSQDNRYDLNNVLRNYGTPVIKKRKDKKKYLECDDFMKEPYKETPNDELGNFEKALPGFLALDRMYPGNANLKFKIGVCILYSDNMIDTNVTEIDFLEYAVENVSLTYAESVKDTLAPIHAHYYLAIAYRRQYRTDDAIEQLNLFLTKYKKATGVQDDEFIQNANYELELCDNAKRLIANPLSVELQHFGRNVNTQYPDYSPVISVDGKTMIFTSRRTDSKGGKRTPEGKYMEDIYICDELDSDVSSNSHKVRQIDEINTDGHEAPIAFSPDKKFLLIYKDDKGDGNLYISEKDDDGIWSKPEILPEPINSKHWESRACFNVDATGIYFVSNRPGGFGGKDIYYCERKGDNEWASEAINLGSTINTEYQEESPYLLGDGETMYFSSNCARSMGGLDVFKATRMNDSDTVWSTPENIGYPINTSVDDLFFVPAQNEKSGYYASDQAGYTGAEDIFKFILRDKVNIDGNVFNKETNEPIADAEVTIRDEDNLVVQTVTSDEDGFFEAILVAGYEYDFTAKADNYYEETEEMFVQIGDEHIDIYLTQPEIINPQPDVTYILPDILYLFDEYFIQEEFADSLDNLLWVMNEYPNIIIELGSHTDTRGTDEYNYNLSYNRANAVIEYLIKEGIDGDRLVAKGYGEEIPRTLKRDWTFNGYSFSEGETMTAAFIRGLSSIPEMEAAHQLNRRTVFKIIGTDFEPKNTKADEVPIIIIKSTGTVNEAVYTPSTASSSNLSLNSGATSDPNKVVFRIQIGTSPNPDGGIYYAKQYDLDATEPIYVDYFDNTYKYTVGSFNTYDEAQVYNVQLQKQFGTGSFIIAYKGTKRFVGNTVN